MTNTIKNTEWSEDDVLFVPLGGSGEIGMNANLYHANGDWLMVDLGLSFPDDSMPGVDILLPDISFIKERKDKLRGIVVTHGHEDHLGAIPYLWEELGCPIYATPFTLELIRRKFDEQLFHTGIELISLPFNEEISIGRFDIQMIHLTHSIPEPAGLVLKAGGKTIFHTGDWKFDNTPLLGAVSDMAALKTLGKNGVDVMVGDSTNAMLEGRTSSEGEVKEALIEQIQNAQGRVVVTCFASNLARVNTLVHASLTTKRSPMLVGRALSRITEVAQSCGYLADWPALLSENDFSHIPREDLLMICTGSQGEPKSALARIALGHHDTIRLEEGDTVIFSSSQIPGNEAKITKVQNNLIERGIEVITDEDASVHASGHAARDEMAEMYQMVRPKLAIPVHGTARHLKAHAALAKECQVGEVIIPYNGAIINLSYEGGRVTGEAKTGVHTTSGGEIVSVNGDTMRVRRRMLWNGAVSVAIVLNLEGELCLAPTISQSGLGEEESVSDYLAEASIRIEDAILALSDKDVTDDGQVRKAVSDEVRSLAKAMFMSRPIANIHILRVDAPAISGEG